MRGINRWAGAVACLLALAASAPPAWAGTVRLEYFKKPVDSAIEVAGPLQPGNAAGAPAIVTTSSGAATLSAPAPVCADRGGAAQTCQLRAVAVTGAAIIAKSGTASLTNGTRIAEGQEAWLLIDPSAQISLIEDGTVSGAGTGIVPIHSTALEACRVLKSGPGGLISLGGYASSSTIIMLFDATSAPADGAVSPVTAPLFVPSVGTFGMIPPQSLRFLTGIVACASSASAPDQLTKAAVVYFSAQVQ